MIGKQICYRSCRDLNRCITDHLECIPGDVDLIVGVPRSGMLAATILALQLDLPLTDVKGFLAGRIMTAGDRSQYLRRRVRKALVVDDSIYSGNELSRVQALIAAPATNGPANNRPAQTSTVTQCDVLYCCIYAHADRVTDCDIVFEILPGDRWIFEWNKLNHGMVPSMCVDLDGLLCRDPTPAEDDDAELYRRFIETAEVKFRPRRRIGWIVTSRLEKYRKPTEDWLERTGIQYGELRMMDLPSLELRTPKLSARFKAEVYMTTPSSLFMESTLGQARAICRLSGRPVLCTQNAAMLMPSDVERIAGQVRRARHWVPRHALSIFKRLRRMH